MKGGETIALITSHMDWLCVVIEQEDENYPKEYLLYYSMLSALFAELQSPVVIPTMIEKLYFKCVAPSAYDSPGCCHGWKVGMVPRLDIGAVKWLSATA
jgi:hypothetical protein